MRRVAFHNRRAVQIENATLRVTVLEEGGHIAEILHKASGVNPLWIPPWPSIEPSSYDPRRHPEYGSDSESRLLAGIMGHNLCLDIFGVPSPEEAAAGLTVHGEASVERYEIEGDGMSLRMRTRLREASLDFERWIRLEPEGDRIEITETVENLSATDRPVGWTEHVTLGPPFLARGATELRAPGSRSKVFEEDFAAPHGRQVPGAEFDWPLVPLRDGGFQDLRRFTDAEASGGFTANLMDSGRELAFFTAYSPAYHLALAYVWKRTDFPWLGIWEENRSRAQPPWNGRTLALGLEFGVSPMPETRRQMIERGRLFDVPCFRWIPARSKVQVSYRIFLRTAERIPEEAGWDGF